MFMRRAADAPYEVAPARTRKRGFWDTWHTATPSGVFLTVLTLFLLAPIVLLFLAIVGLIVADAWGF